MGPRILSAAIGLAIVLPLLYVGGFWMGVLVAIVVAIAMDEWAVMATQGQPHARRWMRIFLIPTGVALHVAVLRAPEPLPLAAVGVAVMAGLLVPMFMERDVPRAGAQAVRSVAGLVYAPLLLAPLVLLRDRTDGMSMILYLLAATWLGDTGAYFAGRVFGKTKLLERISPNKTVEGAVGGLIISAAGGFAFAKLGNLPFGVIECIVLTMVLDVAGIVGDLAESLLKRAWDVKDSGWIMPGHGGILDRLDSLLFTAPMLSIWLQLR